MIECNLLAEDTALSLVLWALARIRAATDRMIKGLAQGDIWDEMLQLMLKLSQQARH